MCGYVGVCFKINNSQNEYVVVVSVYCVSLSERIHPADVLL